MFTALSLVALLIESLIGYPNQLFRTIGHPVSWIGAVISWCETTWNKPVYHPETRRRNGIIMLVLVVLIALLISLSIVWIISSSLLWPLSLILTALFASMLLAQRSLYLHVRNVAEVLEEEGLHAGQVAVSQIVGRDTRSMDEASVCRAAIESLAENFSDGVVAPIFWMVIAGLPGAAVYKTINTADSMVGHQSDRYAEFGWASARLDDYANLPASRLAAVWLVIAAFWLPRASSFRAVSTLRRDAPYHRSPNAGWPEAAMAGAVGVRLSGPKIYNGQVVEDRWMGDGREAATPTDIYRALDVFLLACVVQGFAILILHGLVFLWS